MILEFIKSDLKMESNLYKTIYEKIKLAVKLGIIKKGEKLPSVREAANQLNVSRTTVENAYAGLCIEGIAESRPQKGYYIISDVKIPENDYIYEDNNENKVLFDFSSRRIDTSAADTENWRKLIRYVLRDSDVLTSYGNPRGELKLRQELASYTYKARGVIAKPENIVIGAGIGPLLNILCGILKRDITVGIENGNFKEAESIFSDYGIKNFPLTSDLNGITSDALKKTKANILFLMPSTLSKISINGISRRRNEFKKWVEKSDDRYIVEDDYNGELRYTARTLPAFQSKIPDKCIYIGSFSKLLLPSVRIAYMVIPDSLIEKFDDKMHYYNQTCGKTEQLALTEYILNGELEKHLRRLRRIYYSKNQLMLKSLNKYSDIFKKITLYETSLIFDIKTNLKYDSAIIVEKCKEQGIVIMPSKDIGGIRICFAGIPQEEISGAVNYLYNVLADI